jgi:polar amino acid transport system ATP-binding protein
MDENAQEIMVRYNNVSKSFGEVQVLKNINLNIAYNEKISLIGPSGSGKTTIARMLMTLEKPTSGIIEVEGELLWHKKIDNKIVPADEKHKRNIRGKIGMIFQQFNLFPHMKILKNVITAPINVLGISKEEAEERGIIMLKKVGLGDKLDYYPSQLSGGQQQRVAIARALIMKPKIMLFDEVTSALDPELVGEVLEVIRDIARETEMSMLLITHEMGFARDIADRIVFLADGNIIEEGPPEKIFENPENERTIRFLRND